MAFLSFFPLLTIIFRSEHTNSKTILRLASAFNLTDCWIYHWSPNSHNKNLWKILVLSNETSGNYSWWHLYMHLHERMTLNKSMCEFASVPLPEEKKINNYYNLMIKLRMLNLNPTIHRAMIKIIAKSKRLIQIQIWHLGYFMDSILKLFYT